jgi:hypothetical protein
LLALGESIRLAESFALIWKTTRISNSLSALRFMKRLTLFSVSTVVMMWMPAAALGDDLVELRAGIGAADSLAVEKLKSSSCGAF